VRAPGRETRQGDETGEETDNEATLIKARIHSDIQTESAAIAGATSQTADLTGDERATGKTAEENGRTKSVGEAPNASTANAWFPASRNVRNVRSAARAFNSYVKKYVLPYTL